MSKASVSQKEVIFRIDREEYSISVMDVVSIERAQAITVVPRQNQYVVGVMNLRGSVIPIVDLKKVMNGTPIDMTEATRFIVVNVEGQVVGFIVEEATDIVDIPSTSIQRPTMFHQGFVYGISKLDERMIILLDLPYLLHNVIGEI